MNMPTYHHRRYFVSYSGIKLPLNLVNPLDENETENRNTYFCGYYDEDGRMLVCEKRVYGEVEFSHTYEYHTSGKLKSAIIRMEGDEPERLEFPE